MRRPEIAAECARLFDIHERDLLGPTRFAFVVRPRFALYLALSMRGLSHTEIGDALGRDRTSVRSGLAKARYWAERDASFARRVRHLAAFDPPTPTSQSTE